ncbi:PREDICTED: uncharacterized protein LOC108972469 isoform X1 [Bactrocera latifrons]|uniref:Lipoprotein n=1 Tax=Bactrocera latifrons TaxID=174628 RepID=A0A0K8VWV3_BACLA|nr:PREDICTED: uncharacterized protein LOC108972469 isoform X1 [Bactrocera latifrons]
MKVSTVLIVIAILCTLSSCQQSTDADETTTTVSSASTTSAEEANGLTNTSTGSQPNQVITPTSAPTSAPTTAGSSSESDKGEIATMSYSQWKEETEKRLDEKYDGIKREDLDRDINDLASSIQSALAKPGLSVAKQADLNFAHNLLMKGTANNDTSVKKAAYDEALHILISVVSMLNVGSASLR